jgi:ABC-2 type transport system permease protein
VFALDTMPKAIQVISIIVPARYFVTVVKAVFLKGLGFKMIWAELVFLAIFATIVFLLAVQKMNQKVA